MNAQNLISGLKNLSGFHWVAVIAFTLFLVWLGLVVAYYVWAIRHYVLNYGLSPNEWKVLHPAIYTKDATERKKFEEIREASSSDENLPAIEEPTENPHQNDSFGLPPGTVRGTIALTAMVAVILVEGVNLFSPVTLETHFTELITLFKMVVAFYFGSRIVELLGKNKVDDHGKVTNPGAVDATAAARDQAPTPMTPGLATGVAVSASIAPAPSVTAASAVAEKAASAAMEKALELPAEKPALMLGLAEIRMPNIQVHQPVAPATPPAGTTPTTAPTAKAPVALEAKSPLKLKVLALTSSFETGLRFPDTFGSVAGNFDGQGISFGALQWNMGQGTLQPLLQKAMLRHEKVTQEILGTELFAEIQKVLTLPKEEQMEWAKKYQISKQNPATGVRRIVLEANLANRLRELGKSDGMIAIQLEEIETRYAKAISNCEQYGLTTQRGVALMFDINVQNGLVDQKGAGAKIRQDYESLDLSRPANEIQEARMKIIARRRSEVVTEKWRADVLARKLTVATGKGEVHKRAYDLTADYKIGLDEYSVVG